MCIRDRAIYQAVANFRTEVEFPSSISMDEMEALMTLIYGNCPELFQIDCLLYTSALLLYNVYQAVAGGGSLALLTQLPLSQTQDMVQKTHTFRAYYPYNAAGGILAATTDATAQQNQPAIDLSLIHI